MSMEDDDIHLLPLDGYNDFENSSNESEDNDSIEVVSNVDEEENDIVDMTKSLVFSSDDELQDNDDGDDHCSSFDDKNNRGFTCGAVDHIRASFGDKNNRGFTRGAVDHIRPSFNDTNDHGFTLGAVRNNLSSFDDVCSESDLDASNDDPFEYYPLNVSVPSSSSHLSSTTTNDIASGGDKIGKRLKRKRRQWSVEEKLEVLTTFKLNQNKHRTAAQHGCTTAQLRNWLASEMKLTSISKEKKGKKRRRTGGAGKKLKYIELDSLLLAWYRQRRTKIDPNSTVPPTDIRREKITFKRLQRQGTQISVELKHEIPSFKWFHRFLKRHRLSLQTPKRQQKIPLTDAYKLVSSFHSYIRRASKWGPKRGPMGAFTPSDVCNMDESPLALFGDQSKRSINDIGTPNDIEGNLGDKRFATLILTVFGQNNSRIGPVLIFKGKGRISSMEKSQYAQGVVVFFTPKGVINGQLMNEYVKLWWSKVKDAHPKLLVVDSAGSHLNPDVINDLRTKRVVVAIVPKGCTMYVQVLDVSFFSVFKHHYDDVVEEFIDKSRSRSKIKLSASQSRVLCTRFTWSAWLRTLKSVDVAKAFHDIGYTWTDDSPVSLRSMPGYTFDPTAADCLSSMDDDYDKDDRIDIVAEEAVSKQQKQHSQLTLTQLTITNMWSNKD